MLLYFYLFKPVLQISGYTVLKSRKIMFVTVISLFLMITLTIAIGEEADNSQKNVQNIVKGMSIDEKIGQLLMIGVPGTSLNKSSKELISAYRPGGLILFGYNYRTTGQLYELNKSLQDYSVSKKSLPMFISIDQEGGRVRRITGQGVTQFPGNMAAGSANDPLLTYRWARILALQLRRLGVNMNLAPDIDVNNNPDNPVINTRSFGSNPEIVARHGRAYVKGLQEGGVMAVAKHFPGHGDTSVDSHKTLPVIPYNIKRINSVELVPFKESVAAGVSSVMTAHILYPEIDKNGLPATLSPVFLNKILREYMKFDGLVMTDDMEMGAIAGNMDIGSAAVAAINAGADIILVTTHHNTKNIYNGFIEAYKKGLLTEERINKSVERIVRAKLKYGIVNPQKTYSYINSYSSDSDYREMVSAEKLNNLISQKALYFYRGVPERDYTYSSKAHLFTNNSFIKKQFAVTNAVKIYSISQLFIKLREIPVEETVYVQLCDSQASIAHRLKTFSANNNNIVILSTENPFEITKYSGTIPVLFSFSNTQESIKAVCDALKGKIDVKDYISIDLGFGRSE